VADAFNAFTPDQLPVFNFLASQFGISDNWFSSMQDQRGLTASLPWPGHPRDSTIRQVMRKF